MGAPEQAEKRREHFAFAKAPDWKYTPLKPNRGVPVPYWTIAYFDRAQKTAPSADGRGNEYFIARSRAPVSNGGEAGKGKGVLTGAYMDEFEPKEWSDTLIIEGDGAVFQGHMGTINKGNAPAKVYTSMNPDQAIADKACWEKLKTNISALGITSKNRMADDTTGCLKDMLSGAWGTISGDVSAVGDMLGSVWGGIKAFFSDPLGSVGSAVDGLKQFGTQAYEAGKQAAEVLKAVYDGDISMDDLLDFAADMLQDQLCEMADKIEEMVKQGKGCEAVGVLVGQATEAVVIAAATAATGGAAGAAAAAGSGAKFARATEMLGEAGVKAGDGIKAAIQKLKDLKRKRKEAPHGEGGPHRPKEPHTTDSSTPGYTNPPPCPVCPQVGNPVNPVQGCKVLAGEPDLDFELPGPLPLRWQRTYVSSNGHAGWLGQGWTLPFGIAIELRRTPQGGRLIVIDEFGREIMFPALREGASYYNEFEQITLTAVDAQRLELVDADGTQRMEFRQLPGAVGGRKRYALEAVRDRNGNAVRISYGDHGLPTGVMDSAGRTLALRFENLSARDRSNARNPMFRLTQVEQMASAGSGDAGMVLVRYDYSAEGDLVRVTNALGHAVREFQYRHHMMVWQSQAEGMWSSYDYDIETSRGRVLRSQNALGEWHEFAYGQTQTRVTDHLGRVEVYEFNDRKEWTGTVDAMGGRTVRELDAFGKLIAVVDPAGRVTRYGYDDKGRTTRVEEPGGTPLSPQVTSAVYEEGSGQPASITDPTGATARFRYDARGNLLEMTNPLGHATSYTYDTRGLPTEVTDAQGRTRRLVYDAAGQLVRLIDCSGQSTHYSYDALGHLTRITDALGHVVRYRYDALGRLLSMQQPDGSTEIYAYDTAGRLVAHTDPLGARTEYTLAPDGLPLVRRNALGAEVRYAYDAGRRLSALHNENGARCDFRYDALNRLLDEIGFDGRHTRYRYDPVGLLLGKLELGCLSATQRLAQRLSGDPEASTRQGVLPPQRTTPTYEDPWGLGLADEVAPAGRLPGHAIVTTFVRDAAGRLIEKQVAGHVLDAEGRAQPQTRRTRYGYDEAGRLVDAANDAGSRSTLAYDALGQLTQEARVGQGIDSTLGHRFDALGHRTSTTLPHGSNIEWLYYGSGHLHQVNIDGQVICDIERDALHRETGRSQGQLQSAYRYDPAGRLTAHTAWMRKAGARQSPGVGGGAAGVPDDLDLSGATVLSRHYRYDASGQLLEIADRRRGGVRFGYDRIGRLLSADQGDSNERFAFDPAHNLLTTSSAPSASAGGSVGWIRDNRVEVFEDKRYRYDSHGNLIEKKIGRHTVIRLYWDVEHQLSGAHVTRNGVAQETQYAYDAFGRRILKRDRFGKTLYTWDGNQLLSEQRGDMRRVYVYEPGGMAPLAMLHGREIQRAQGPRERLPIAANDVSADDEWQPRRANSVFVDRMLAAQRALRDKIQSPAGDAGTGAGAVEQGELAGAAAPHWHVRHYQNDHLGTPRELTDEEGSVIWSASYRAWGNTLRMEAAQADDDWEPGTLPQAQHAIEQNLRFQGQYFDTETGLHYSRFRYYDPDVGRFVSQDPIGLEGAQNLYMYAPNPTGWIDPFGLACLKWNPGARRWQNPAGRFVRLPTRNFLDKALSLQGLKSPPASLKQSWLDGGYKYEVRAHPANPAHGSTGSIYRVSRQMPGQGTEYMDIHGCWHHESTLKEFFKGGANNPNFNSAAAADTHIPF
ncbi:RHS repeat-associated core domain-containing protein [Variovorax sp. YR752]|uniref:RHS repeat-associated core domain-containing protein n=1 Tax=Variovorax sp. YR752 TaxID=1884383 RepID=UPI000BDDE132|nr:RHS repeat-associated core domain-containing protein [Variovorax sp. YR752]SOD21490.1 RHS repeat-associated core domain-containing protein [Variovorax sp. YR752]